MGFRNTYAVRKYALIAILRCITLCVAGAYQCVLKFGILLLKEVSLLNKRYQLLETANDSKSRGNPSEDGSLSRKHRVE